MANETKHNFVFSEEARRRFPELQVDIAAPQLPMPVLVTGDFVRFDALGDTILKVIAREVRFVSAQQLEVTYVLDTLDDQTESKRTPLTLVRSARGDGG